MSISSQLPPVSPTRTETQQPSLTRQVAAAPVAGELGAASDAPIKTALALMVQQALSRQDSVVGLTTALISAMGQVALPDPVVQAAQQVLGQQLPLDGAKLDGAALQRAVLNSGLFQEAKLAAGMGPQANTDLKSTLLSLQRSLAMWLGNPAPPKHAASLPPPTRGMPPRARQATTLPLDLPEDPHAAGEVLLERTEAALSRLRLHQNASLPEATPRQEGQWSLDLPVVIAGQQNLLQMQIHRDAAQSPDRSDKRGWQVRFAINLGERGEVGAQISLRGSAAGVMIWAAEQNTASLLSEKLEELRKELHAAGLDPGSVLVRSGAPAASAIEPSAHLLDEIR